MTVTLKRNLACLDQETAGTLRAVAESGGGPELLDTVSRSGITVTGLATGERQTFFHSVYDPLREAERLASGVTTETVICLGFGTGHHIPALLEHASRVIVAEPEAAIVVHALSAVEHTHVLQDPKLTLLVGADAEFPAGSLPSRYLPALHGSASVVVLAGRVNAEPERFAAIRDRYRLALDGISDDFAVQARFGRSWMRNTLLNLSLHLIQESTFEYPRLDGAEVIVTAAGPSLPGQLDRLDPNGEHVLIATDTSLPTLVQRGIRVDATFAIDCQPVGYLHFLAASNPRIPLLADLAVPQVVMECGTPACPLLSHHPLSALLAKCGVCLPEYDSAGGNVTDSAVRFALDHGARTVAVLGADLAYPQGECYSRGSYVHAWFTLRASRTRPLASEIYRFAVDRPGAFRDADDPSLIRLPVMEQYRERLRQLVNTQAPRLTVQPGLSGVSQAAATDAVSSGFAAEGLRQTGVSPPDRKPSIPVDLFSRLEREFRTQSEESQAALLPLLAWIRRTEPHLSTEEALSRARRDALHLLQMSSQS